MKEAVGGSWLFTLVIVFVALFTSFICLATNYSKCYKVKDEILNNIEQYHGMNKDSLAEISKYLAKVGYRNKGSCPSEKSCAVADGCGDSSRCWVAFSATSANPAGFSSPTNFCVKKTLKTYSKRKDDTVITNTILGYPESAYYSVVVFFALDIPILREVFNLSIEGDTSLIFLPGDFDNFEKCHAGVNDK